MIEGIVKTYKLLIIISIVLTKDNQSWLDFKLKTLR
jgi:hypothetical protein